MAVQIAISIKVLHGDGTVMTTNDRTQTIMNPMPRDTLNDGDLAKEHLELMMKEMTGEASDQVDAWKQAVVSLMGGGPSS